MLKDFLADRFDGPQLVLGLDCETSADERLLRY